MATNKISIESFIPSYPSLQSKQAGYEIARKKEFYDLKLERSESTQREQGDLLDSQKFMKRFFSPDTPYRHALVFGKMGSGKSCVISAIAESNKNSDYDGKIRKPAIVFVKNEDLIKNLVKEIANVCTKDVYVPKNTIAELKKGVKMTKEARERRIKSSVQKTYKIVTWDTFLKKLEPDEVLKTKYNGSIIMIDEAHALRIQPSKKKKSITVKEVEEREEDEEDVEEESQEEGGEVKSKEGELLSSRMIYKQLHHFLHTVEDCRILLFTGTPIWDKTSEIASLMNLILEDKKYGGKDEQLPTGSRFEKEFFNDKGELKDEAIDILKEKFRGKVSFLREMVTSAKREQMGTILPWFKHIKVYPCAMSEFQAAFAEKAKSEVVSKIVKSKGKQREILTKGGTVRKTERAAANMVLPIFKDGELENGAYDNKSFDKYVKEEVKVGGKNVKRYNLKNKDLKKALRENLNEYSAKLAAIIDHVKANPNEVTFIYTGDEVEGIGGAILDALILQEHGFVWAKTAHDISRINKTQRRFAVLSSNVQTTSTSAEISELLDSHNKADNCYGDRLQIIIGSRKASLGLTIKHVRRIYIKMPHWNIPQTEQALFRGFRFGSHEALKPEERYVKIFRLVAVNKGKLAEGLGYPKNSGFSKDKTSDIEVYQIAEEKEYKNTQIYRLLKEAAFDCALNYKRNVLEEDIDGTRDCDYRECNYKCDTFPESKIDKKGKLYNYSIPEDELDYSTYNLIYSNEKIKIMRDRIIELFNNYFFLKIDLVKRLLEISEEETYILLEAIDSIIENRILIRNRYGFGCYLKEQNNILFLDNSISPKANYPEATYIENPLITEKTSMESFAEILELEGDKIAINEFCENPTFEDFEKLSHRTKIVLLEASHAYFVSKKKKGKALKIILDRDKGWGKYLHTMADSNVIHILYTEEFKGVSYDVAAKDIKVTGLMRIFDEENEIWRYIEDKDKEEEYVKELKEENVTDDYNFEGNPYGVAGWISERDKKFRIIIKSGPGKKTKSRGRVCSTFKIPELLDIFINKLNYYPKPKKEHRKLVREELLKEIRGKVGLEEYTSNLEDKDEKQLRGLLTLLSMRIPELCAKLEEWLAEKNLIIKK